jgi:hypothetical protein
MITDGPIDMYTRPSENSDRRYEDWKSLPELVVSEDFRVDEVFCKSERTSATPQSEIKIGGTNYPYRTGYITDILLVVSPQNEEVPVEELIFYGNSAVMSGDTIQAKIPRHGGGKYIEGKGRVYLDRPFGTTEEAIEIELKDKSGKVLREDKSVNYDMYFPRKIA